MRVSNKMDFLERCSHIGYAVFCDCFRAWCYRGFLKYVTHYEHLHRKAEGVTVGNAVHLLLMLCSVR